VGLGFLYPPVPESEGPGATGSIPGSPRRGGRGTHSTSLRAGPGAPGNSLLPAALAQKKAQERGTVLLSLVRRGFIPVMTC